VVKEAWTTVLPEGKMPEGLKFKFQQFRALSQVNGGNNFCGYYALFFLLQSVLGQQFADENARENFNTMFQDWIKIKARKSLDSRLYNMETVPNKLLLPEDYLTSLDPKEICDIMMSNPLLKDQANWYVIDAGDEITDQTRAFGDNELNHIYPEERNLLKSDVPLFLIVKQRNGHYYFVNVYKISGNTYKFKIAHSLPGNVGATWSDPHWKDLLNYVFRVGNF
jgi:hypothetical protein